MLASTHPPRPAAPLAQAAGPMPATPEQAAGGGDNDEARIARAVQAHCLENQLSWMRRSVVALPVDLLWGWLSWHVGLGLAWWAPWLAVRLALHAAALWQGRRLQQLVQHDPARGLRLAGRWLAALGCWHATLMPAFYIGTDDTTRLLAMALSASYFGGVIVSASGQQRTFWAMVLPGYAVYITGWLLRGGPLGWVMVLVLVESVPAIIVAINQQRRAWEDLVRLADERERLAASLAAARDRAEAASAARTRFFAAASHDLRQPLHALSVNATTLDLLATRAGEAQLMALSQGISRALAQSQGLLDALLDISRLDAGAVRLHLADVDVAELLQQLQAACEPVARQRGLALALAPTDQPAWARTDVDQLQRILRNLLDNALKFTDSGTVRLSLLRLPAATGAGHALHIRVADTGCGIADADRERVFEEFYQAHNPTRDRGRGLGLGLAIVRRTAALLDAQVRLLPAGEQPGCVFELVLPALDGPGLAEAPGHADVLRAAPAAPSPTPLPAVSVLVVDDEPDILQALAGLLRAVGWQPHAAEGLDPAAAALALAGDARLVLDAAIIDHRLPGCTGVDLALRLRALRPALPVLVVTGDLAVHWQVRRHGLQLLHKPLDGGTLTQAIADQIAAAERWAGRRNSFTTPDGGPPMNLIDALHGRRSVRAYLPTPLPRVQVEDLVWHAAQIPRPPASHAGSWAFHLLEGQARLADFGERAKRYAAAHPPPGEPWTWPTRGDFEVFWGAPLAVLLCARHGHPEAPFDCCRAGQNLSLLAHAQGLGSCWIGAALPWLASAEGREAVQLPTGFDVAVVLVLGHPSQAQPGQSAPRPALSWAA